jgi:hypothetical protein
LRLNLVFITDLTGASWRFQYAKSAFLFRYSGIIQVVFYRGIQTDFHIKLALSESSRKQRLRRATEL